MPTLEQMFVIARITDGYVLPNDWFGELPRPIERIVITPEQHAKVAREPVILTRAPRRRRILLEVKA
jgi:hypothetical protein